MTQTFTTATNAERAKDWATRQPTDSKPYADRAASDLCAFLDCMRLREGNIASFDDWASHGLLVIDAKPMTSPTGNMFPHMFIPDCFHLYREGKLSARSVEAIARVKAMAATPTRPLVERIQELRELQNQLGKEIDALVAQLC